MKKNWGCRCIPKSYNGFCIGLFLPIYGMYYKSSRARTFILKRILISVINCHKEIKMVSNYLKKYGKYHERKKNGNSMLCYGVTRENARACACARFFIKCLKWPKTYAKYNLRRFWEFWKFARALTRGRTRMRAFFDLKLTGLILTFIMINMNEKWLLVMKIWSWVDFQKILQNGA